MERHDGGQTLLTALLCGADPTTVAQHRPLWMSLELRRVRHLWKRETRVCGLGGVYLEVTLTFWRGAHNSRLVSMATVSSDKGPAPAVTQPVFVSAATQALVVEESGAGAELGVFERRADVAVGTKGSHDAAGATAALGSPT